MQWGYANFKVVQPLQRWLIVHGELPGDHRHGEMLLLLESADKDNG